MTYHEILKERLIFLAFDLNFLISISKNFLMISLNKGSPIIRILRSSRKFLKIALEGPSSIKSGFQSGEDSRLIFHFRDSRDFDLRCPT